jgi:hypothetical protein
MYAGNLAEESKDEDGAIAFAGVETVVGLLCSKGLTETPSECELKAATLVGMLENAGRDRLSVRDVAVWGLEGLVTGVLAKEDIKIPVLLESVACEYSITRDVTLGDLDEVITRLDVLVLAEFGDESEGKVTMLAGVVVVVFERVDRGKLLIRDVAASDPIELVASRDARYPLVLNGLNDATLLVLLVLTTSTFAGEDERKALVV